jgi:hypothetical protein
LLELGRQPGEESSSAGEQLVSNEVDAFMKREGWLFVLVSPIVFGMPGDSKKSFLIGLCSRSLKSPMGLVFE